MRTSSRRKAIRILVGGLLAAVALTAGERTTAAQAKAKDPAIVGVWTGGIDTDAGSMKLTLTVKVTDGKLGGDMSTPHGAFVLTSVTEADGHWTLKFQAPDGEGGQLKGALKGDVFSGQWDFAPRATGTFEFHRDK
jgi:hypothetical protein